MLFDAAYFAKQDSIRGVGEKIIVGDMIKIGTGHFDLLYDQIDGKTDLVDEKIVNRKGIFG